MSTSNWKARERTCGKEIKVEIDDENGTILKPESCPYCEAKPFYVDFIEQIEEWEDVEVTTAAFEFAEEHGIDLSEIEPTGKNGAIIYIDVVKAFIAARDAAQDDESGGADSKEQGEAGEK